MESKLIKEEWRDVIGYEGLYQVSNLGRVRSLDRINVIGSKIKGKMMSLTNDKDGYKQIKLRKEGENKTYKVHRLVAQVFIPNPDNLPQVNHINEFKADNSVCNLEWCSEKYNTNYGNAQKKRSVKRSIPIIQMDMNGNFIKEWNSAKEVACYYGRRIDGGIRRCCRGEYESSYGYRWKDKEEKVS